MSITCALSASRVGVERAKTTLVDPAHPDIHRAGPEGFDRSSMPTRASISIIPGKETAPASRGRCDGSLCVRRARRWAHGARITRRARAGIRSCRVFCRSKSPVDLLIVEGFKCHRHPKIEISSSGSRQAASASGRRLHRRGRRGQRIPDASPYLLIDLNDVEKIADAMQAEAMPADRLKPLSSNA